MDLTQAIRRNTGRAALFSAAALLAIVAAGPVEAASGPHKIVFQRGAGDSSQTVSYWAGSSLPQGGGGPVPNFVNPPQPAWIDVAPGGDHTIDYAKSQPIALQNVFFNIITNKNMDRVVCVVSAKLHGDGSVTDAGSNCPASIVVKTYPDHVAVMLPPQI